MLSRVAMCTSQPTQSACKYNSPNKSGLLSACASLWLVHGFHFKLPHFVFWCATSPSSWRSCKKDSDGQKPYELANDVDAKAAIKLWMNEIDRNIENDDDYEQSDED